LVELFSTIGKVARAEIQYEANGRSRGTGVVQFEKLEDAVTSIGMCSLPNLETQSNSCAAKFTGYQYGGRPLGLSHVRYTNLSNGGEAMEAIEATGGLTQDQIM
jgi:RNA recognition motif-containing protein